MSQDEKSKLTSAIAKRFAKQYGCGLELEDLIQEAHLAEAKKQPVDWRLRDYMRNEKIWLRGSRNGTYGPRHRSRQYKITEWRPPASRGDHGRVSARLDIEKVLPWLEERDRRVLYLLYWEQWTMKETGESLGVTEGRISQIHKAALKMLRERMEANRTETDEIADNEG